MNDYYAVLEISPGASADEIRMQYLFLVKAWHPDKFQNPEQKAQAEERTKRINEAYAVLGNPDRRAQYDREWKATASPPAAKPHRPAGAPGQPPAPAGSPAGKRTVTTATGIGPLAPLLCLFLVLCSSLVRNLNTFERRSPAIPIEFDLTIEAFQETATAARMATRESMATAALQLPQVTPERPGIQPSETAALQPPQVTPDRPEIQPTEAATPEPASRVAATQSASPAAATQPPAPRTPLVVEPAMVYIPDGLFWMGAVPGDPVASDEEKPGREVQLSGYWIDATEVTNAMFAYFVEQTGYRTDAEKLGSGWVLDLSKNNWEETAGADWRHPHGPDSVLAGLEQHPVVQVSWNDAAAYCRWRGARLPTEAEWEKAARGTDQRIYPWGESPPSGELANFADRSLVAIWSDLGVFDGFQFTAPVGSYPDGASPYGLFDMAGNVWEWVQDWYDPGYYGAAPERDPAGPDTGSAKVLRGGCWGDPGRNLRASVRYRFEPDYRIDDFGFRCAR